MTDPRGPHGYVVFHPMPRGADDDARIRKTKRDLQAAQERLETELVGETLLMGRVNVKTPLYDSQWSSLGRAIEIASDGPYVLVIADLEPKWAQNGPFRHRLTFSARQDIPVAFTDLPDLPIQVMSREVLRELYKYGENPPGPPGPAAAAEAARERRLELAPAVLEAYASEGTYAGAARTLNEAEVETLSGEGSWHPQTVKRVVEEARKDGGGHETLSRRRSVISLSHPNRGDSHG